MGTNIPAWRAGDHPREGSGRFTEKPHAEASTHEEEILREEAEGDLAGLHGGPKPPLVVGQKVRLRKGAEYRTPRTITLHGLTYTPGDEYHWVRGGSRGKVISVDDKEAVVRIGPVSFRDGFLGLRREDMRIPIEDLD